MNTSTPTIDAIATERLHRAIDARAYAELGAICELAGSHTRAFDFYEEAASIAISLAWETDRLPLMFEYHEMLREAWENTRLVIEDREAEQRKVGLDQSRMEEIEAYLRAENWEALGLPSPQEALATVLAGAKLKANDHVIEYDPDTGITWYTNPYGLDGIFCNGNPRLDDITGFLKNMAQCQDYGLIPF